MDDFARTGSPIPKTDDASQFISIMPYCDVDPNPSSSVLERPRQPTTGPYELSLTAGLTNRPTPADGPAFAYIGVLSFNLVLIAFGPKPEPTPALVTYRFFPLGSCLLIGLEA